MTLRGAAERRPDVVLDLVYEARDVDQEMGSGEKIDQWFEAKTRGLNDWQKDELMKCWGTLQKLRSSRSRMNRVVADITGDFGTRPRLASERGNAMLVASSIYEASRYYELFQDSSNPLRGCCRLVTSHDPSLSELSKEETGEMSSTDKQVEFDIYERLLEKVSAAPGKSKAETYEDQCKADFLNNPGRMKLLIVVDKLLTGFDAPSCTYLYIDKTMRDHGLFQAICRTNRLDGDDKEFGYIVDYKDLFTSVENAMAVYTSELAETDGGGDPNILLQDRLKRGRDKLEDAFEQSSRALAMRLRRKWVTNGTTRMRWRKRLRTISAARLCGSTCSIRFFMTACSLCWKRSSANGVSRPLTMRST